MSKYLIKSTIFVGMDKAIGCIVNGEVSKNGCINVFGEELLIAGADRKLIFPNSIYPFILNKEVDEIFG